MKEAAVKQVFLLILLVSFALLCDEETNLWEEKKHTDWHIDEDFSFATTYCAQRFYNCSVLQLQRQIASEKLSHQVLEVRRKGLDFALIVGRAPEGGLARWLRSGQSGRILPFSIGFFAASIYPLKRLSIYLSIWRAAAFLRLVSCDFVQRESSASFITLLRERKSQVLILPSAGFFWFWRSAAWLLSKQQWETRSGLFACASQQKQQGRSACLLQWKGANMVVTADDTSGEKGDERRVERLCFGGKPTS